MSLSTRAIERPVATSLLTIALLLAGALAFFNLPVSPLPEIDFPVISVNASLPGASPETMASAVATPLERQFGRIAGVNEMTSVSQLGTTNIILQFDLDRDINGAARDVEAAINAARAYLPSDLPTNPWYWKVNPADSPILILALTSDALTKDQIYDAADSIIDQKLSQIPGVGQVFIGGSSQPAVRIEANPTALNNMGLGLEAIRNAVAVENWNQAKGSLQNPRRSWMITDNDQLKKAKDYRGLIIAYHNGAPVRLEDVARVIDSYSDIYNAGSFNGKPSVLVFIFRQPGANIIDTVDRAKAALPFLKASLPASINLQIEHDRTVTVRASVADVEITLCIAVLLVVLVVFAFLREVRATLIPGIAVPLSIAGTFAILYVGGYSLDNLSLMALTISTGFVVDDAIVVIENIMRHIEGGMAPYEAAVLGSREIGFTVLSMSVSLMAVFIPLWLMGGIVGRLFREFAVTISAAITVSLFASLTTTPMLCAQFLKPHTPEMHGVWYRISESGFYWMNRGYRISLAWVLRHQRFILAVTLITLAVNVALFIYIPKGFFPQQDIGRLMGTIVGDQDISFAAMKSKTQELARIVQNDPDVETVAAYVGGGSQNTGRMYIGLKPLSQRHDTADQVIDRLRGKLSHVAGITLYLIAAQDLQIGGRHSNSEYQYTLMSHDLKSLYAWAPRLLDALRSAPQLRDVNSDQQMHGLMANVVIDRDTAARLGITPQQIDDALYDAFGQRQISTIYEKLNQYHVVLEVDPRFKTDPDSLNSVYVIANGAEVPLSAFVHFGPANTALAVNHQGQFPAVTISFNLAPGVALGQATRAIEETERSLRLPASIHGSFAGTAAAFQQSLSSEPLLILAALLAVYIVLGILYESYIHPITILSTLPSAGTGALLALLLFHMDLDVISLIGIILLIGIVKKNAIMMIDFALEQERQGKNSEDSIHEAALLRFRPIMMTTMAALLGAVPLAFGRGMGSELHRPLGIAIVGGLIVSQMLTLYTTPVVYLYLDRLQIWLLAHLPWRRHKGRKKEELPIFAS
ncbi:MAG TPA: multidrug efflux RND transporter permease subunit [Terriglobales bacterium]|nr:multidrug efflux RND transporter permease subunit [Terriglobales bacterium]